MNIFNKLKDKWNNRYKYFISYSHKYGHGNFTFRSDRKIEYGNGMLQAIKEEVESENFRSGEKIKDVIILYFIKLK